MQGQFWAPVYHAGWEKEVGRNVNGVKAGSKTIAANDLCCTQVLHELVGDKSLERFCVEYEKVFQAVRKSHGNDPTLPSL